MLLRVPRRRLATVAAGAAARRRRPAGRRPRTSGSRSSALSVPAVARRPLRHAGRPQRQSSAQPIPLPGACITPAAGRSTGCRSSPRTARSTTAAPNGCAGMAPEAANVDGPALPSNTTYGVTDADGTGSAKFDVWTARGERVARLLGHRRRARWSSCRSWASAATRPPRRCRPTDQPADADERDEADATVLQATGQFAPGELSPRTRRARTTSPSAARCGGRVELAQPDHGPADVRAAVERLRHRWTRRRRSTSTAPS